MVLFSECDSHLVMEESHAQVLSIRRLQDRAAVLQLLSLLINVFHGQRKLPFEIQPKPRRDTFPQRVFLRIHCSQELITLILILKGGRPDTRVIYSAL